MAYSHAWCLQNPRHHEVRVHLYHDNARLVDRTSRDDNISTTKFEEEELAARPLQGKETILMTCD